MNKNKTALIIGTVVILVSIGVVALQHSSAKVTTPVATVSTTTLNSYTLADVASHKTQADCWTVVNGEVYNVTSWISKHPGGAQAIVGMCGVDGSAGFNGQHGTARRPTTELASFKIGTLK